MNNISQNITQILRSVQASDPEAREQLIEATYDDLRRIASSRMAAERQNHTLTATALVNEVSLKLLQDRQLPTENRDHFFAYASRAMRNMLIDHARSKVSQRRGGKNQSVPLDAIEQEAQKCDEELLALDDSLTAFAEVDSRKAKVVEMKFFGRMTIEEIASALDISVATVKRDWEIARAWLRDNMSD
jgi:RNA polymerase sigma factor (TIGR02999 family)